MPCPSPLVCLQRNVRSLCKYQQFPWKLELVVYTSDKERVSGEDGPVISILEEIADAVLRMTWRMESFDVDVAHRECLTMAWGLGNFVTILAANYWDWVRFELERKVSEYVGVASMNSHPTISALPPAWS